MTFDDIVCFLCDIVHLLPIPSHLTWLLLAVTQFLLGDLTFLDLLQTASQHFDMHESAAQDMYVDPYAGLGFWERRRQKKMERDMARQYGGGSSAMWTDALPEPGSGYFHQGEYVDVKEMKRREKQRRKEEKEMDKLARFQAKEEVRLAKMEAEEKAKEARWRAQQEAAQRREEEWHMQQLLK